MQAPGMGAEALVAMLDSASRHARDVPAVVLAGSDEPPITYGALHERVTARAAWLRSLLGGRTEPVVVLGGNDEVVPELVLSVIAAGCAVVPVTDRLPDDAVARIASEAGARLGICSRTARARRSGLDAGSSATRWVDDRAEVFGALPEASDDGFPSDAALICFTSGTTGTPKGVVLTHQNLFVHVLTALAGFRINSHAACQVNPMPLSHLAGATRIFFAVASATPHVVVPTFDAAAVLDAVARHRGTHLLIAPAMAGPLLDADPARYDLSTLEATVYGTARMPTQHVRDLHDQLGCGLINGYGLTESTASVTVLSPDDHRRGLAGDPALLASAGRVLPGVELRVVDDSGTVCSADQHGEIQLRGLKISPGYLKNESETRRRFTADGWLRTGDEGSLDEAGYLTIHGRVDDMVISGGINIQPAEVELEVADHPDVVECGAFGVASPRWGSELHVAVVPRRGADVTHTALAAFLRTRIDPYKIPKQVHLVSELPRNHVGKVDRRRLRASVEGPGA